MNKLPKDLTIGRETKVKIPKLRPTDGKSVFAVCMKTDDEELLVPTKIYKIVPVGNRAGVTDEEGEAAVYPLDFFLVLPLSPAVKNKLAEVVA